MSSRSWERWISRHLSVLIGHNNPAVQYKRMFLCCILQHLLWISTVKMWSFAVFLSILALCKWPVVYMNINLLPFPLRIVSYTFSLSRHFILFVKQEQIAFFLGRLIMVWVLIWPGSVPRRCYVETPPSFFSQPWYWHHPRMDSDGDNFNCD